MRSARNAEQQAAALMTREKGDEAGSRYFDARTKRPAMGSGSAELVVRVAGSCDQRFVGEEGGFARHEWRINSVALPAPSSQLR